MKIIKLMVTISILNAVVVVLLALAPTTTSPNTIQPVPSQTTQPPNNVQPKPPQPSRAPTKTPPVVTATPRPSVFVPAPKAVGCVIQIDGAKYEITPLLTSHSGGNIFSCGTDMSAIFWGKHGAKILQKMQQYRI